MAPRLFAVAFLQLARFDISMAILRDERAAGEAPSVYGRTRPHPSALDAGGYLAQVFAEHRCIAGGITGGVVGRVRLLCIVDLQHRRRLKFEADEGQFGLVGNDAVTLD